MESRSKTLIKNNKKEPALPEVRNSSINRLGNWGEGGVGVYAGFQVGIQKKRGSGCSVPFPPLPFLAQTAIGLAANRGEESRHRLRRC